MRWSIDKGEKMELVSARARALENAPAATHEGQGNSDGRSFAAKLGDELPVPALHVEGGGEMGWDGGFQYVADADRDREGKAKQAII